MHRIRYFLGLATLLLAVAGAFVLMQLLRPQADDQSLLLRVEFRDARGLRPGADVRYRGVPVGSVRTVQIGGDGSKAVAELLLEPAGAEQARVNSVFWIVTPRFSGITGGATGLETLVRDTYVAFLTPEDRGSPLLHNSLVNGSERPATALDPDTLEPLQHGDLLMSVLVPENHGLEPGSPVVFRGMRTGDVRGVELAEDGSYVTVRLRIARRHRQTVTDRSAFWIARPYVSGALFSGFTVSDVRALLSPYVSYHTPQGAGVPVEDGFRVAATAARPDVQLEDVPKAALQRPQAATSAPAEDQLVLVRIVYAAVEEDTWSADDPVRHEGTGVLYLDGQGRAVVVTARSLVDGTYTESDPVGDVDIAKEQLKVLVPDGPVLRAHRVWVAGGQRDLAVLVLADAPPDLRVTPPARLRFDAAPALKGTVLAVGDAGGRLQPAPVELPATAPGPEWRGGAIVEDGVVVGIYGTAGERSDVPACLGLDVVPVDLRPR